MRDDWRWKVLLLFFLLHFDEAAACRPTWINIKMAPFGIPLVLSCSPYCHTNQTTSLLHSDDDDDEDGNYGMGLIGAAKTSFEALGKTST